MKPGAITDVGKMDRRPAAQRGDRPGIAREAAAAVLEQHQHLVFGFLRARLRDAAAAEDLCQEVFLRYLAGGHIAADRPPSEQAAWLVGIARNVLREHVRRSLRRREVSWTSLCLEVECGAEAETSGAADETIERLPACLRALGPTARSALDLHYGDRLRLAEIARRFERSTGAVKLLLFRARQAVRRCLERAAGAGEADDV